MTDENNRFLAKEEEKRGEKYKEGGDMMMDAPDFLKVYRMNNLDYVAAFNEQECKDFYAILTRQTFEEIEKHFKGQVDSREVVMIDTGQKDPRDPSRNLLELRSLNWIIENQELNAPCIIGAVELL